MTESEAFLITLDSRDARAVRVNGADNNFRQYFEGQVLLEGEQSEWEIALAGLTCPCPATVAGTSIFVYCSLAQASLVGSQRAALLQTFPAEVIGTRAVFEQRSTIVPYRPLNTTSFGDVEVDLRSENGLVVAGSGQCVVTLAFRRRV
eukprot:m.282478 g.282478  ORF g.282478 m.282478 type:complete len:148 (+) comp11111_c0_seq19:2742-3185(+)